MDILIATLEDLKAFRPDLCDQLYQEFLKKSQEKKDKSIAKDEAEINPVKIGDVLRWNYTREEGIVVGFESYRGKKQIVVEQYDGTKINFDDNPRLFTRLEDKEKEAVISQRKKYLEELRRKKQSEKTVDPKKIEEGKPKPIEGVTYYKPTRKGSKLKVGDRIRYKVTDTTGRVSGFIMKGGLDRIIMVKSDGSEQIIIDNPNIYEIIETRSVRTKRESEGIREEALVGNIILYDSKECKVIKKEVKYGSMRLVIKYDNGIFDNVPNDWNRYTILKKGYNLTKSDKLEEIPAPSKRTSLPKRRSRKKWYEDEFEIKKNQKDVVIGDWVMRNSDNTFGEVVGIRVLGGGIERILFEVKDVGQLAVFKSKGLYVLFKKK